MISLPVAQNNVSTREDIAPEYTWNLGDIYPTTEDWEADYTMLEERLGEFKQFEGKLKSGKAILSCLQLQTELSKTWENLFVYANLGSDMDTRNTEFQGRADRAGRISNLFSEATSFVEPELQTIPVKKLKKIISKTAGLQIYKHYFDNLVRQRDHILSLEEERILSMAGDLYSGPSKIHEAMTNTDLEFPMVKDDDGNSVQFTVQPDQVSGRLDAPGKLARERCSVRSTKSS